MSKEIIENIEKALVSKSPRLKRKVIGDYSSGPCHKTDLHVLNTELLSIKGSVLIYLVEKRNENE